ncbi:MAG: glycine cleavage system protein GcvH [Spirochaetia bacterium]|nr:glycine cleavage system protein GcvH [Spirochaetia bacterium]
MTMSQVPEGLYFTKQHEWAREEGSMVVIGITDFAQHSLGDIVYVDLKQPGFQTTAGQTFGTIESVKAAEDLYAPVSGKIAEVNADLNKKPELVNKEPYASWMIKLSDYKKEDLKNLMDAAAYTAYIQSLEH